MTTTLRTLFAAATLSSAAFLTACGGGGGARPVAAASRLRAAHTDRYGDAFRLHGCRSVVQVPVDAYGPVTIGGTTFQSAKCDADDGARGSDGDRRARSGERRNRRRRRSRVAIKLRTTKRMDRSR